MHTKSGSCLLSMAGAMMFPILALAGPVNLNQADAATIARELTGIGDARAKAIVEYRDKNGSFEKPEDLLKVSGVGPQILEANRVNIVIPNE